MPKRENSGDGSGRCQGSGGPQPQYSYRTSGELGAIPVPEVINKMQQLLRITVTSRLMNRISF